MSDHPATGNSTALIRRFFGRRLRELAYTGLFSSIFILSYSPLHALVIDDIRVLSRLGEPLQAEIRVTAAAGEYLTRDCFSSIPGRGDLPRIEGVRLSLTRQLNTQVLLISSARPIREPMSEFVLQVKCPGAPTVVRSFMVMIDPAAPADIPSMTTVAASGGGLPSDSGRALPAGDRQITPGARYTVQSGDMLSTIAARVAGRPEWSVWPLAQKIHALNPGAFLLGDPNMLAQGATIYIPRLDELDSGTTGAALRSSSTPGTTGRAAQPAATAATRQPAQPRRATAAPARAVAPTAQLVAAAPLRSMQITGSLLPESRMKLQLRRRGVAVPAAVVPGQQPATLGVPPTAALPAPDPAAVPQPASQPETPGQPVSTPVAAIPAGSPTNPARMVVYAGGLFLAFLLGLLAALLWQRRARSADEELLADRPSPTADRDNSGFADHAHSAAVLTGSTHERQPHAEWPPIHEDADTSELPALDLDPSDTAEVQSLAGLDLELPQDEPARTGDPETLEMPGLGHALDLELSGDSSSTGQHDVDFDLLEQAYSEEYETEFVRPDSNAAAADDEQIDEQGTDRYYHLENRDPTDEAPLPIELGDDEMSGESPGDDAKVVNFPKSSSSG